MISATKIILVFLENFCKPANPQIPIAAVVGFVWKRYLRLAWISQFIPRCLSRVIPVSKQVAERCGVKTGISPGLAAVLSPKPLLICFRLRYQSARAPIWKGLHLPLFCSAQCLLVAPPSLCSFKTSSSGALLTICISKTQRPAPSTVTTYTRVAAMKI